jgi:RNAse (barnase) inhibitor barstar
MAAFSDNDFDRLDWQLLQNGAINLYYRPAILDEHIAWLVSHAYLVHEFDCSIWTSQSDFHEAISAKLNFPGWYGQNIDAFNDCLCDIEIPDNGGTALVFRRFDCFLSKEPEFAEWVLDVIQDNSRLHSLFGQRLFAMLQSDDPSLKLKPVGECHARWNRREWFNSDRGL